MGSARGTSLGELLLVILIVALAVMFAVPAFTSIQSGLRTAAAAGELARCFQALRWQSITTGRSHGLLFGRDRDGWYWHRVMDSNGNGVRAAEVRSGLDATLSGPHRLDDDISGVRFGFPGSGPFRKLPPASGWLAGLDDPIRIGHTDLVAFSALGTSTSGSFFVTDGRHGLAAVVLYGKTVRVRVWSWDAQASNWSM